MRKLSIAIAIESYDVRGGVEHRTRELVKGLIADGHDLHIYAGKWNAEAAEGVTMHRIPVFKPSRVVKPLSFAWSCSNSIPKGGHDLVHTQARIFRFDAATLGVGCHRAYMDAVNSGDKGRKSLLDRSILFIEQSMFKPSTDSRLIVNSNKCKEEFIRYYNVSPDRITVVHNGVDCDKFSPSATAELRDEVRRELGLAPDDIVVSYVGSGFHRKGLDTLVEAVGRIKQTVCIKILIAGRGNRDVCNQIAARYGIGDRLVWLGQSESVARVYSASDIFALPTRYDPFANSTMEALASGLPVVTTSSNGVSEILDDGVSAFITPAADSNALAERLELLACDESMRMRIGAGGCKAVEPYTWEKTTAETIAVYHSIIAERGKS
ncbi:MAG: glycosyltransferase family 4 protein [Armatimonadota bacterium]